MKLKLEHEFELTVGEDTFKGLFVDLTKKETKKLDEYSPTDELKKASKLQRKIKVANEKNKPKLENELDELIDIIDSYDTEKLYLERLTLSIKGDDKDAILAIGEQYGYSRVFDTIIEDIAERKEGN